tara:strand:+ start:182 stop:607 length:426 start_codon:yes stop_codon:yes gene_type:complete
MGMKQILVIMVVLVGCSNGTRMADILVPPSDEKLITDPIVEKEVRKELKKPEGEITESDLGKVESIYLRNTQITDEGLKEVAKLQKLDTLCLCDTQITDKGLKEVAKLQNLKELDLSNTKSTKAGVAELQKALPNCKIVSP